MNKHFKFLSGVASMFFAVAVVVASWPCPSILFYQPKEPKGIKALRKF